MKQNDLLLYGGLAVLAYLVLKPKTTTSAPSVFVPAVTPVAALPVTTTSNPLASTLTNIANTVSNLLNPPPAPVVVAPANTSAFDTQIVNTALPTAPLPTMVAPPFPPVTQPVQSIVQQPAYLLPTPNTDINTYTPTADITPPINYLLKQRLISGA